MKKRLVSVLTAMLILLALPISASASNFTPSVEQKGAPAVSAVQDKGGNSVSAIIRDAHGNEVIGVPATDLIVTPVSEAENAADDIRTKLLNAYKQINSVGSLSELADNLKTVLSQLSSETDVADLVVRDLFDVTVQGTYAEHLAAEGNSISIQFELGLEKDQLLLVLHNLADQQWEVIPNDQVVRGDDGSVTVTFNSLSPVAFAVDNVDITADPNAPKSPQTSQGVPTLAICGIALLVVGAAAACVYAAKRKKASK